jgi:hypothetical protein
MSSAISGLSIWFFDAALQRLGLPANLTTTLFLELLQATHSFFTIKKLMSFNMKDSVNLQDDPEYTAAHQKGVDELFDFLTRREKAF